MLLFSSSLSLSFYAFQFVFGLGIGDELAKGLLMCFIYESSVALVRALVVHICLFTSCFGQVSTIPEREYATTMCPIDRDTSRRLNFNHRKSVEK